MNDAHRARSPQRLPRSAGSACSQCGIRRAGRSCAGGEGHIRRRRLQDRRRQSPKSRRRPYSHPDCSGRADASRCRSAIRRQDADRRTGFLADRAKRAFSATGKPGRTRPRHRWLFIGIGRRGRRRARRHCDRLRHRRLDPRTGKLLRADRPAHHAWPYPARRHHAAGTEHGHFRLVCERHCDL